MMKSYSNSIFVCVCLVSGVSDAGDWSRDQLDFFESKIRPVLVAKCHECHSAQSDTLQANLRVDFRDGILRGGDSGAAVVPKKPDESLLLEALHYKEDGFQMPPDGKLSPAVIADFEKWIQMGCPDPRKDPGRSENTVEPKISKVHWSFQPIRDVTIPEPQQVDWCRNEIDRFILSELEDVELAPAKDTDKRTLLRRVYMDLIGLPPTPEQMERFLAMESSSALARVVDELLDSPRFGERWARHWLDIVRYAESSGGGRTLIFPNAWRYRDYVVDAFNNDKPYNEFVMEQIAGDLMESNSWRIQSDRITATGFLALGPTNYELQDKELLRMEVVDEQMDTIGRSMLGLTIGCARCHDHKFDPIPTSEYYALAGIFRSTKTFTLGNVANFIERPISTAERHAQIQANTVKLKEAQQSLSEAEQTASQVHADLIKQHGKEAISLLIDGEIIDNRQASIVGEWTKSTHTKGFVGEEYLHDDDQGKGDKTVTFDLQLAKSGRYQVFASYTPGSNRTKNAAYEIVHLDDATLTHIDQTKKPPVENRFVLLGTFDFSVDVPAKVVIRNEKTTGVVIVDAIMMRMEKTSEQAGHGTGLNEYLELQQEIANRKKQIEDLKSAIAKNANVAMSVREEENPHDWHIHIRGQIRSLGPKVERGFLSVLQMESSESIPANQSGRMQLARWIASDQNPLTSRVMVNRIWLYLLGKGIVATPDAFGSMGQKPSHPELLDFLAKKFVEDGWSIKSLIRTIILSRTYGLAAHQNDDENRIDPENRLFSQREPKRMEAEAIRDAMLFVSGKLDLTVGGPTQTKNTKSEIGYKFFSNRRSIYVPWFRNNQLDFLQVFDAPNPNVVTGLRTKTSLPTQALYLMNSPIAQECALALSVKLAAEKDALEARIHRLFEIALCRSPSAEELQLITRFMASSKDTRESTWAQVCHTILASADFRYVK